MRQGDYHVARNAREGQASFEGFCIFQGYWVLFFGKRKKCFLTPQHSLWIDWCLSSLLETGCLCCGCAVLLSISSWLLSSHAREKDLKSTAKDYHSVIILNTHFSLQVFLHHCVCNFPHHQFYPFHQEHIRTCWTVVVGHVMFPVHSWDYNSLPLSLSWIRSTDNGEPYSTGIAMQFSV